MNITIDPRLKEKLPNLAIKFLKVEVKLTTETPRLDEAISKQCQFLVDTLKMEDIAKQEHIHAAREAYKICGKKPSRYRLSAEALMRRALNGKGLYSINNVVDAINLSSLKYGVSIGGYDADAVQGDVVVGIGEENEPYEAIGRGALNIFNMPVLRDELSAFGSMTSDSVRTSISEKTKMALFIALDFKGTADEELLKSLNLALNLDVD